MNRLSRNFINTKKFLTFSRKLSSHPPKGKESFPTFEWKKASPQDGRYHTNEDEASFCGYKPGDKLEGWEPIAVVGIAIMIYFGWEYYNSPDNSVEVRYFFLSHSLL